MKKFLVLLCIAVGLPSLACTTFFINHQGHLIFGRNYDWITGNGLVYTNQRGLAKTSFKTQDGGTASWISLYGSITFNQYGKEFPTGGINEKGLVIELMWLDGTQYPSPDERPSLGVLQWIQYHLDLCSNIDELVAKDKNIRIASKGTTPLHYLVADATGNAAVIEFLGGKMKVYRGKDLPFPVLANDRYDYSLGQINNPEKQDRSFTSGSLDRFTQACQMITNYPVVSETINVVEYSFKILDAVAQGSHTKWSIVYDISNKKIYFKSLGYPQVKEIRFSAFNYDCKNNSVYIDINQATTGDISPKFHPYSFEKNASFLLKSFDESSSQIRVSKESVVAVKDYPSKISCYIMD